MSTYYNYYVGYKTTDGKYHAFGPYTKDHELVPILSKSRSFVSDLYHEFFRLNIDEIDDELNKKFVYKTDTDKVYLDSYYLDVNDLPDINFMKTGYYLTNEIMLYMTDEDFKYDPYFSEYYSESEYAIKLSTAVKNNDLDELKKLKEFSFFTYPDYRSVAYDSFLINQAISYNGPFNEYIIKESLKNNNEELSKIVILLDIC